MDFSYAWEEMANYKEGDIFKFGGKWVRLRKKTTTMVALEDYRWYHRLYDWLSGRKP